MRNVYVLYPILNTGIDVSKAAAFGHIIYVFEKDGKRPSIFKHVEYGRAMLDRLDTLGYDPELDYFCCAGSMVSLSVALITLAMTYPKLRVLLFDATHGEYIARDFTDICFVRKQ